MIFVFYFFATILVLLSAKSFVGGLRYKRFFEEELAKQNSAFSPFVSVFAPCRGLDEALEKNLLTALGQVYPAYEVIFIVDDKTDAAVAVIDELISKTSLPTKLIVAPKANGCSQKVENLREGIMHADSRSEMFVFVDSDVRVASDWLTSLIAPLEDTGVGASTGYRWFISDKASFADEMRSVWNASIASALGPDTHTNFCWGGSMAMRRDVFDSLDIREQWRGTLSDDFSVTRAINKVKRPIVFVPAAMSVTNGSCTFGEFLEFTTRQMKITRVNAPNLWLMSLFGSTVFNTVVIAAMTILLFGSVTARLVAIGALVLIAFFSMGKAWLRLSAVRMALKENDARLRRQTLSQTTLWLATPSVFLYNSIAALVSHKVTWRGISYRLKSPNETVIITD
jgi:ceramide glucosyltransferase